MPRRIDLILLTFNREDTIAEALESVRSVDFNKVICVDHNSSDRTIDILKSFFPKKAEILYENEGIGYARTIAIEHVESPFFFFLDSDVVVPVGFIEQASKYLANEKVGAVQGKRHMHHEFWGNVIRSRIDASQGAYRVLKSGDRPFTGATLVRTAAAKGADLSPYKMWEDYFLMRYMQKRGYSWLEAFIPITTLESRTVAYGNVAARKMENEGAAMRLYRIKNPREFFLEQTKYTARDLFYALRLGKPRWVSSLLKMHWSYVRGYLTPRKYLS